MGLMPFLDSLGFREILGPHVWGRVRYPKFPTMDHHEICGLLGIYAILASVSFRGIPAFPFRGAGYGDPMF